MKKLSMAELGRITSDEFKKTSKIPVIVILDNIRSMNNVGSIFRTCDAFAVEKLYLCGITATPPHKDIAKTALGATESVEWEYAENVVDLVHHLRKNNTKVFLIEQTDSSVFLNQFRFPEEKIAIILGNEVFGISEELLSICDGAIEIPQYGTKHSLNVTIAAGIVLWECLNRDFIN
ncbi:MAG: RNA methyltransferase [Bacteroidetes bacterium]|nr:RNA methyltransferase [Bacteroidota bacterium]MCL2301812.1 RNA methyltransferase [Lentimicrobiaceae bacterium]